MFVSMYVYTYVRMHACVCVCVCVYINNQVLCTELNEPTVFMIYMQLYIYLNLDQLAVFTYTSLCLKVTHV